VNAVLTSKSLYFYVKSLDGRYTFASRLVELVAGQQVTGRTDEELFAPEVTEVNAQRDRFALERREPAEAEQTLGGRSFLTVSIPLMSDGGEPYAVCGIGVDITDYKLMTERLMAVQRLEILGHLAADITHEFHNILSVVLTFSELLVDAAEDDEVRHDAEVISSAARRGTDLTRQLLLFGGQRRPDGDAPVLVADAVLQAERLLARTLGPDITIETNLSSKAASVEIGAAAIDQILMNLALNARDAMPEGGRIVIRTASVTRAPARLRPPLKPDRSYVRISVSDTGLGMPPRVALRALEPYFTTKARGEGTGLGLATVHEIAKQSGGGVSIDTAEGRGTTVHVYLPVVRTGTSRRFTRRPASDALEAVILVAELDDELREGMAKILMRAGYVTVTASDSDELLATIDACDGQVDLIIVDRRIGTEVADELSVRAPDAVLLHAASDAHGSDVEPLVVKPFTAVELLSEVRKALMRAPRRGFAGISNEGDDHTATG
jgi:signal transduction histidine kinase/CheY-like chemotaxis protein